MAKRRISFMSIALLLASGPLLAHHSGAMFDRAKKVTITGTVVQFQYVQPHSWIDVKTTDADGKEVTWAFEAGAPPQMRMVGLIPGVLNVGDKVTITGHPLRDAAHAQSSQAVAPPSTFKLPPASSTRWNSGNRSWITRGSVARFRSP